MHVVLLNGPGGADLVCIWVGLFYLQLGLCYLLLFFVAYEH